MGQPLGRQERTLGTEAALEAGLTCMAIDEAQQRASVIDPASWWQDLDIAGQPPAGSMANANRCSRSSTSERWDACNQGMIGRDKQEVTAVADQPLTIPGRTRSKHGMFVPGSWGDHCRFTRNQIQVTGR